MNAIYGLVILGIDYAKRYTAIREEKGTRLRAAFFCSKRALAHAINKNHELKTDCDGCKEIIGFLEIPGYSGDQNNPVGVDGDRPY